MIFTVSMGDLFGDWVPAEWIEAVIKVWLGTTVTGLDMDSYRIFDLIDNTDDKNIRFVSFEPYLNKVDLLAFKHKLHIDWIIIGAQTNPYRPPKREWVEYLIKIAREVGIAVFLKNNLRR